MKWLKNLINLAEKNLVGECPHCGSCNTAFGYKAIDQAGHGYGAIWCNNCKKGYFLDKVNIKQIKDLGEELPNNISYTD